MNHNLPAVQRRLALIREALAEEPMSPTNLAKAVFIVRRWVHPYVNYLHGEVGPDGQPKPKEIYIAEWGINHVGGSHSPVYAIGDLPDAKNPRARSSKAKAREQRQRLRSNPAAHALHLAKRRGELDPLQLVVGKQRVTD